MLSWKLVNGWLMGAIVVAGVGLWGCERGGETQPPAEQRPKEGPAERAGEQAGQAVDKTAEKAKEMGRDVRDRLSTMPATAPTTTSAGPLQPGWPVAGTQSATTPGLVGNMQDRGKDLINRAQNYIDKGQWDQAKQMVNELQAMKGQFPEGMQQQITRLSERIEKGTGAAQEK